MKHEIISTFKEHPKTKIAWWAMWLGLSVIGVGPILGTFAGAIRPIIDKTTNENVGATIGFSFGIIILALSISALFVAIRAYKLGERSWVMWVGLVPAIIVALFWILMIVGEFIFPH